MSDPFLRNLELNLDPRYAVQYLDNILIISMV